MAKRIVLRVDRNLARRLREARQETGLSTRAIAERLPQRLRVSHTTIASYENGVAMPPIDVLAALADIYKRTLNWFLDDRNTFSDVRLRNPKPRVSILERRQFEAVAAKWSEAYQQLERYLKMPLTRNTGGIEVVQDTAPRRLAIELRKHLGMDDAQPVTNMVEVLEQTCAIRVLELKTELAIDGLAARHGDGDVVILNPQIKGERQRVNAAYELAHVFYRTTGLPEAVMEKHAYEFASHLLLPDSQLVQAFDGKSFLRLIACKEKYGVSIASMIHRAEQLRLIKTTTSRGLWTEMVRRGWKDNEPGYVCRDRAIRFETMLESSIQTKSLSWSQAESVTGVREDDLRQRLIEVTEPQTPTPSETGGERQYVLRFPDSNSA